MTLKSLTRNSLIGLLIVLLIYGLFYMELDIPLMYFIYTPCVGTALASLCHLVSIIFAPLIWLAIGVIALAYAGMKIKNKQGCPGFALYWGAEITIAFILMTVLKVILARYRPIALMTDNLYGFHFFSMQHNINSTPSGHATMAFAGLFGLGRRLKSQPLMILFLLIATLVAISRLIIGDHYISDVILGAYLGITSVYWTDFLLDHYKKCPQSV
jgi:membrane-associated phospholipid phosphatase